MNKVSLDGIAIIERIKMHPDEDGRGRERNKVIQYTSENNKVIVAGKVNSPLIFGHEIYGKAFITLHSQYQG